MPDRHDRRGGRYPGYDVLSKRTGPSWNEPTRRAITRRLAVDRGPHFFTETEFQTVTAIAARIVPQPPARSPIPVASLIDHELHQDKSDGYRIAGMPRQGKAWQLGLRALDTESEAAYGGAFRSLADGLQDHLLARMHRGELNAPEWAGMRSKDFFVRRMAHDIVSAYYAHPTVWSEIGWGGPASPRGYVRLDLDERDPWEPAEAIGADDEYARRINRHVR
jgi:hypothetical protein